MEETVSMSILKGKKSSSSVINRVKNDVTCLSGDLSRQDHLSKICCGHSQHEEKSMPTFLQNDSF